MSAPRPGLLTTLLLRAGLLTATLAILAGIFGMHIMTGAHSMPADAAETGTAMAAQMHSSPAHHPGHGPANFSSEETAVVAGASQCADPHTCPAMSSMDAVCVLSPGNTPLSAPPPGTAPFPACDLVDAAAASTGYSYLPGSPSPCELCISRT
ncbi:hypothetical protein [Arthrobacter sp. 4R501]|uniref:hypothetical protein n=1 Tax=Arthrobacter sp. 4R501 TaxID=2058886 RepID=UPI000CE34809|nr:hypothetical protein [Arthrobacter sp. 4R501]